LKPEQLKEGSEGVVKRTSWVSEVTRDAVKHFVWGIGDNNPLWMDPDYGSESTWGKTIAPPSFAYAIDETSVAPGHEAYERHYQSVDWEWSRPFEIGDQITSSIELVEESYDASTDVILQTGQITFVSGSKAILAKATVGVRRDRTPLLETEERKEIRYDGDELLKIEENILSEICRGSSPRFFEEITIGEDIGVVTKGPLSIMDIVAWSAGTIGAPDDNHQYSSGGLQIETATGPQLTAWIIHLITNWMGDDGFLKRLGATFHSLPSLGSTTTITGSVTDILDDDAETLCELSISCELQNNELAAEATALVRLPTKEVSELAT